MSAPSLKRPVLAQSLQLYCWMRRHTRQLKPDARVYYGGLLRSEVQSWSTCTDPHTLAKLWEAAPTKVQYVLRRFGETGAALVGEPPLPPTDEQVEAFRQELLAWRKAVAAAEQG